MKYFIVMLLITSISGADVIIGPSVKYGPNGYETSGASSSSSTTTTKKGFFRRQSSTTISSSSSSTTLEDRIEPVLGFKLQTVPDAGGISFGGSYYMDSTIEFNLGFRL